MTFTITGLAADDFSPLFDLSDEALAAQSMLRMQADADFGYPDRVSLSDVPAGTELILLNYQHQSAASPYRASGPIFVSRGEGPARAWVDIVPECLARRPLSLRAYDRAGMMLDATLIDGTGLSDAVSSLLDAPGVDYIHAHYASRGCFAARIDRGEVQTDD